MVVATRLGLILTFLCFAWFGFSATSVFAHKGAVVFLVLAAGLLFRGIRAPLSAAEAWLTASFSVGMATGAIPAGLAVAVGYCTEERGSVVIAIWLVGLAATCAASAATVRWFRPELILRRVLSARVLWLIVGPLMAFATYLALTSDPCWLSGKPAVLALPSLTNALLGLFFGWYLAERDPETL